MATMEEGRPPGPRRRLPPPPHPRYAGAVPAPTPLDYADWRARPLGAITEAEERRAVLDLVGSASGARILDVGCGDGAYLGALSRAGAVAFGLDRSRAAAARALASIRAGGGVVAGDAAALPFRAGAFDLVLAVTALCFVEDPVAAVREMARALRPGGTLVLGELNASSTWAAWRRLRGWLGSATWRRATFWSAGRLRRLLRGAGLVPGRARGAAFHPPLATAARLLRPLDAGLGRWVTFGAAFVAVEARKPSSDGRPRTADSRRRSRRVRRGRAAPPPPGTPFRRR